MSDSKALDVSCTCAQSRLTHCSLMDCSLQDPLFTEFSRQQYWSGLFPSPGDLPDPGIEPVVSCVSGIGRWVLCHCITGEAP